MHDPFFAADIYSRRTNVDPAGFQNKLREISNQFYSFLRLNLIMAFCGFNKKSRGYIILES